MRLIKHRVAADSGADDYYGDKIKTKSDYRAWLRTQAKNRKAAAGVVAGLP